jgi:hypothetical protein
VNRGVSNVKIEGVFGYSQIELFIDERRTSN